MRARVLLRKTYAPFAVALHSKRSKQSRAYALLCKVIARARASKARLCFL